MGSIESREHPLLMADINNETPPAFDAVVVGAGFPGL